MRNQDLISLGDCEIQSGLFVFRTRTHTHPSTVKTLKKARGPSLAVFPQPQCKGCLFFFFNSTTIQLNSQSLHGVAPHSFGTDLDFLFFLLLAFSLSPQESLNQMNHCWQMGPWLGHTTLCRDLNVRTKLIFINHGFLINSAVHFTAVQYLLFTH